MAGVDPLLNTVRLQSVFLHVTKACNLRCSYCYCSAAIAMPDELTRDEFESFWPDMVKLRPQKVVFTGGEPLLRADIFDLLGGLRHSDRDHVVLRCLNTNGHLVTSEFSSALVGLVDEVRVSIDALSERNDALRGRGNFAAVIAAFENLYAVGFEPKALVTVTSYTLPDLEELLCLLLRKKITRININPFRAIGRGRKHADWLVSQTEIRAAVARAWARSFPGKPAPSEPDVESVCSCGVGRFLNIAPNGDVFPCHVLDKPEFRCGNLRQKSLLAICSQDSLLGRLAQLDFRELARQDKRLTNLTQPDVCLGNVYKDSSHSPAWRNVLPILRP
jgi:MoaA/NifB/PqqE/SkfB family radical SAM enzyme